MPNPFFLDELADDVTADFAARGVVADVLVGEWETFRQLPGARVILGLGAFQAVDIGGAGGAQHYMPGAVIDVGPSLQARALWGSEQAVILWVTSPAPSGTPGDQAVRGARAATWALTKAALAAMWRSHGGTFPWGAGKWLKEERGERLYGAALSLEARITISVEDDPLDVAAASEFDGSDELDIDAGTIDEPTYNMP